VGSCHQNSTQDKQCGCTSESLFYNKPATGTEFMAVPMVLPETPMLSQLNIGALGGGGNPPLPAQLGVTLLPMQDVEAEDEKDVNQNQDMEADSQDETQILAVNVENPPEGAGKTTSKKVFRTHPSLFQICACIFPGLKCNVQCGDI